MPAADGSLIVEQNYTRVGTDQMDQLFDQAVADAGRGAGRAQLMRKADARIWAAAGSIPLYQRPQLAAVRKASPTRAPSASRPPLRGHGLPEEGRRTPANPSEAAAVTRS